MRNKWILSILMTILALPFLSNVGFAEETVVYEDGEYEIQFEVKHATEDKVSSADGFLTKPAKLTVKDGSIYVQLELKSSSMIKSLTVPSGEVDFISENEENDTRVVGFEVVGDLTEPIEMKMHVIVPPNPFLPDGYDTTHTARAFFDVSEVPLYEEKPVEEPTEPEEKPTEPETIDLADGFYTINSSFLHLEEEKASMMARYLDSSLFLEVISGKIELTVTVNADETVTLLKVDGKEAVKSKVDGEKRYDTYELDSLATTHHGYVDYQAPMGNGKIHYGDAEFRITLAEDSIKETDATTKPGYEAEAPAEPEDPSESEAPADKEDENNKPGDKENPGDKDNQEKTKPQTPADKDLLAPDKAYEIDFVIKHETEDKSSAANSFFKGPAILLEKDGERYIQFTVTGKQYIDSLKNKFGEMVVVKEVGDTIVYQFKLDSSLSEAILLDMIISVPGFYENQEHTARLFLDESSMKEVDASTYRLVASNNANGPTVEGESGKDNLLPGAQNNPPKTNNNNTKTDPTIEKPEFESNETNKTVNESKIAGQEKNPQTGDTTNILLYVLLLIGSAIPLAIMAKKRFANVA